MEHDGVLPETLVILLESDIGPSGPDRIRLDVLHPALAALLGEEALAQQHDGDRLQQDAQVAAEGDLASYSWSSSISWERRSSLRPRIAHRQVRPGRTRSVSA